MTAAVAPRPSRASEAAVRDARPLADVSPSNRRLRLAAFVGGVLLIAIGALAVALTQGPAAGPRALNGVSTVPARQMPELSLTRANETTFSSEQTRGTLSLFFFGYTSCPDVCPLTLANVSQIRRGLADRASDVETYFVTVDPARDTPERMRAYLSSFPPGIVGLTGDDAELARARDGFGAIAQRRPAADGGDAYTFDHTAGLFLVDADGQIRLVYPYGTSPDDVVADLKQLLDAGS